MDEFRMVETDTQYDNGWYTGGYDRIEQPDGSEKDYYWAELEPAVAIVAIHKDNLIFVEQYRPAAQEKLVGVPTGMIDEGESYETAAERELREETGYEANNLTFLTYMCVAPGVLRHKRGIVVAEGLEKVGEPDLDENEFLTVRKISIETAFEELTEGPVDEPSVSALLLARAEGYL